MINKTIEYAPSLYEYYADDESQGKDINLKIKRLRKIIKKVSEDQSQKFPSLEVAICFNSTYRQRKKLSLHKKFE